MPRPNIDRAVGSPAEIDRYRKLFENSGEPILIIDDGRFIDCNQAAVDMLGYPDRQSVLQCHPSEISPEYQPDGQRSEDKANGIMARAGKVRYQCFEWTHIKAGGTPFPTEVALTVIPGNNGELLHVTWRDISARKKLENELRHSQKMDAIGKLAGGIAHDFNNHLVPILGYAKLLANALEHEPRLSRWAGDIHRAASLAAASAHKLLALSRKDDRVPIVLDMNDAILELSGILNTLIGEETRFEIHEAGRPLWVKIPPGDVEQIVMNLASNARDALAANGEIRISVSLCRQAGRDFACLEISDNGIGMDAETLSHIYEPFFTTKELGSGTGLGLSTVYGTVSEAGGSVDVSSEPGQGTTFVVRLPIADEAAAASTPHDKARRAAATDGIGRNRILVVEDSREVVGFVNHVLREHGFDVTIARDGRQALNVLDTEAPDLLLTDIIMGGLNGPELVRRLEERGSDIPVIFMSGHTDNRLAAAGLDASRITLLRKPFTAQALLERINRSLARKAR